MGFGFLEVLQAKTFKVMVWVPVINFKQKNGFQHIDSNP